MASIIERVKRRWMKNTSKKVRAERMFVPVKHAGRLAVLYRADDENHEHLLKKVSEFCNDNHLKMVSFGYFDDKELRTHLIPHSNADFFCNKHLDTFKLPHKSEFLRFTSEKFDYLLNLYSSTCLPLLGVSSLSEAKFRVGPYWPEYDFCFDLLLKTDNNDIMHFTDEVLIYLKNFGDGEV
jgi:hypothetical protein